MIAAVIRSGIRLGMSETTDTLVLIISEEMGQLSVARNGRIYHNLSPQEIRKKINEYLTEESQEIIESETAPENEPVTQISKNPVTN